jgi:hypothetical protein
VVNDATTGKSLERYQKIPRRYDTFTIIYLVGGLEHEFYDFPYIGNFIIPTDEIHHFSEK